MWIVSFCSALLKVDAINGRRISTVWKTELNFSDFPLQSAILKPFVTDCNVTHTLKMFLRTSLDDFMTAKCFCGSATAYFLFLEKEKWVKHVESDAGLSLTDVTQTLNKSTVGNATDTAGSYSTLVKWSFSTTQSMAAVTAQSFLLILVASSVLAFSRWGWGKIGCVFRRGVVHKDSWPVV